MPAPGLNAGQFRAPASSIGSAGKMIAAAILGCAFTLAVIGVIYVLAR
jgi:hypothetical protein